MSFPWISSEVRGGRGLPPNSSDMSLRTGLWTMGLSVRITTAGKRGPTAFGVDLEVLVEHLRAGLLLDGLLPAGVLGDHVAVFADHHLARTGHVG